MNATSRVVAAALLAAAAAEAVAQEHVLFEVQGKDTVLGTIRPADEREAILGRLVAGTAVKASVKSTQKTGPVPTLQLLLDELPVAGAQVAPKGRGAVLAPFVVTTSGTYKVVVVGDVVKDGDYQLAVTWTPQKAFVGTGTSAGDTTFGFSVPAGAVVSVSLAAAPGSAFVPHLLELDGPEGAVVSLAGGGRAPGLRLAQRGDWTLHFQSDAADGAYRVTVKVAPPKVGKHKADIRDSALSGAFSGGSNVFGAVLTPDDGGTIAVDGQGSAIDGSSVTVPPGSLGQATSIFVAQAAPYTPPGSDHPAGPAVEFGPSGTQFDPAKPATVTIPFDPDAFPGGTGSLIVYVKDKNGVVTPVLPTSAYVIGTNTVTFTTSHFSIFQAATSADRGGLSGDYTWIDVSGEPNMNFAGSAGVGYGAVFFTRNGFDAYVDRMSVAWDLGLPGQRPPGASVQGAGEDINGGLITQVNDSSFQLRDQYGQAVGILRRGITDDVFVLEHVDGRTKLGATVLLRRTDAHPTLNSLAGRWHAFVWEASGASAPPAGGSTSPLSVVCDAGSAVISAAGTVTFKFPSRVGRTTALPGGEWAREVSNIGQASTTIFIDNDFIPEMQYGSDVFVGLDVCAGGDVLVARFVNVDRGFGQADAQVSLLVMVRESSGASAAGLAGDYADVLGGLDLHAPDGNQPPDSLGVRWRAQTGTTTLDAKSLLTSTYLLCRSDSANGDPTSTSNQVSPDAASKFSVAGSGAFAVPSLGLSGAAGRSGNFVVYLRRDPLTMGFGFALRLPPPGP